MELQLKNIGMIKEANVKIDGLTVIAGENDTGKSTVGKALYLYIKSLIPLAPFISRETHINGLIESIFQSNISNEGNIALINSNFSSKTSLEIEKNRLKSSSTSYTILDPLDNIVLDSEKSILNARPTSYNIMIIETPIVLNLINLYYQITQAEKRLNIRMDFPELMYDLIFYIENKRQVRTPRIDNEVYINQKTAKVMGGRLEKDSNDNLFFNKSDKRIELINTATGIKSFGILQLISENGWLDKNTVLVLDEPEVHLHPKWQLEMAKIIVELVKNGVKIVVNSHSPYMIEALELYSSKQKINRNFYLAEKKDDYAIISDVTDNLEPIYSKLAEPIQDLEDESLENFEW